MIQHIRKTLPVLSLACLAAVAGCSGKNGADDTATTAALSSPDSILRYIPADSPYVFVNATPVPDDVYNKVRPKLDEMLEAYQVVIREVVMAKLEEGEGDEEDAEKAQRIAAAIEEILGMFTSAGMSDAGISRDSAVAIYGNGLLPVMRIELEDAAKFDAAVAAIEEKAGNAMSTAVLDHASFRFVDADDAKLVLGVFGGDAVFTIVPASFTEAQLDVVVGNTLPAKNIAESGELAQIASDHGYTSHYVGYFSLRKIAETFVGDPTGINADLLALMDNQGGEFSEICREEVRELADLVPRIVFGYHSITTDTIHSSAIIELRQDIAAGLALIPAQVPGLGTDPGGLMSFGMSVHPLALREFYEARLDAIDADPWECAEFAELQQSAVAGRMALNQPLPPIVYDFRGFYAVVDDIDEAALANNLPPTSADASVLIAMENAPALLAMGAMFSPELASLGLEPDGVPVAIDSPQLAAAVENAYAAMTNQAIVLSVGEAADSRVTDVLGAETNPDAPFMSVTMDARRYYKMIGDAMMVQGKDDKNDMPQTAKLALRDSMTSLGEIYDRMAFNVEFTDRGIEIDSRMTLSD